MPSAHDEYRTDPEIANAIAELADGYSLLDPFCGLRGQPSLIAAKGGHTTIRIYRTPRKPRVSSGAFSNDWLELLIEDFKTKARIFIDDGVGTTRHVVPSLDLGHVFINPPYSNPLQRMALMRIAHYAERAGLWQTALVPSSTGSAAFQHCYQLASQVCFLRGRRRFWEQKGPRWGERGERTLTRSPSPARFDSAILHFCQDDLDRMQRFRDVFGAFGIVQDTTGGARLPAILHTVFARPTLQTAGLERPPVRANGKSVRRRKTTPPFARGRQTGQATVRGQQ